MISNLRGSATAVAGLLALTSAFFATEARALEVGQSAPCVELLQVYPDGLEQEQCIRDKTGAGQKFTLLEFFSIDCSDCAENLPIVSKLSADIVGTTQTRLVSIDRKENRVRSYIGEHEDLIRFPVAFDLERDAKSAYGVKATPTLFVLDQNYRVVFKHVGVLGAQDLARIRALVD